MIKEKQMNKNKKLANMAMLVACAPSGARF